MDKTERHITWLLDIEERPFTLNNHYLQDYKEKFLSYYRDAREKECHPQLMASVQSQTTQPPSSDSALSRAIAALAEAGVTGIKPEDFAKLIPPDGMEHALVIMADVRAYFQGKPQIRRFDSFLDE